MSTQAFVQIDSAASATLSTTAVIPVLNGAVTGTGNAIGAQTTLADLATFFASGTVPVTLLSPTTLGSLGAAFTIQGTTVASVADTASGAITLNANIGRGTGAVGGWAFAVPLTTSTGTTAQTLANALVIKATTVQQVFAAGADATATGIISTTNASLTAQTNLNVVRASATAGLAPALNLVRMEGTLAAPTIILNTDILGNILFRGAMTAATAVTGASVVATATEAWVASTSAGTKLVFNVTPNTTATAVAALTLDQDKSATFAFSVLSTSPTGGVGYATGAGGAQVQGAGSGKATTVVSNTATTAITMNNAALNAGIIVSFTFTNSAIASTDTVLVTHESAGTIGCYSCWGQPGAGTSTITIKNISAGNLSEAIVLRVTVIKSVSA